MLIALTNDDHFTKNKPLTQHMFKKAHLELNTILLEEKSYVSRYH